MKYIILLILEIILIAFCKGKDVSKISSWLLGINFTLAIFSVNFAYFGYQLYRYKSILEKVTMRQWFNIIIILILPFIPIVIYLVYEKYFALSALIILPLIVLSAIDNAKLTWEYLDPLIFLKNELADIKINQYLDELYKYIEDEVCVHEKYLKNIKVFQIPTHEWSFETYFLGRKKNDLWDKVTTVLKIAIENNDHPVYQATLDYAIKLLLATYRYNSKKSGDYNELNGLQSLSKQRFRGLLYWVQENDDEGIYIETWSNKLCAFLKTDEALNDPLGELTSCVMSDITYIGTMVIVNRKYQNPIKILNTIHAVMELSIHKINSDEKIGQDKYLDKYNIAGYADLILSLGKAAINAKRIDFLYRCMETLSYLGCNSAKINSRQSIVACLEALVQLGRISRKEGIVCFWSRCIIPLHLHAEEFMGHMLTWLIRDIKQDGSFTLKSCAEQAYARLQGFECKIVPKAGTNTKFWIEDMLTENKERKPHVESLSGMYGYSGVVDYSDYSNITEYRLLDMD